MWKSENPNFRGDEVSISCFQVLSCFVWWVFVFLPVGLLFAAGLLLLMLYGFSVIQ